MPRSRHSRGRSRGDGPRPARGPHPGCRRLEGLVRLDPGARHPASDAPWPPKAGRSCQPICSHVRAGSPTRARSRRSRAGVHGDARLRGRLGVGLGRPGMRTARRAALITVTCARQSPNRPPAPALVALDAASRVRRRAVRSGAVRRSDVERARAQAVTTGAGVWWVDRHRIDGSHPELAPTSTPRRVALDGRRPRHRRPASTSVDQPANARPTRRRRSGTHVAEQAGAEKLAREAPEHVGTPRWDQVGDTVEARDRRRATTTRWRNWTW